MRPFIFLFVLLFQTKAVAQNISKEDSIQRESERIQILSKRLKQFNELCKKDSLRAVEDSKTQNKLYIFNTAPSGVDFPAKKELQDILKNNNILWGGNDTGSDIPLHYTTDKCYSKYMNFFTNEKFGKEFINNLIKQAVYLRIEKEPILIFEDNDHLEWLHEGKISIADSLLNKYFFESFKYPKGYKKKIKIDTSYTEVSIGFDGLTIKAEEFIHHFETPFNKKFAPYFEYMITRFLKSRNFVFPNHYTMYEGFKRSFKIYYKN
ncbi:hypothetical protein [Chryseobacterium wangxinyae]|uniref:hypothetical protein n=1 Tax=Chryseobacterium sp. CY353 TaxID=2997334 RepID=UPI002271E873|nr:hypothetical protein [Chryseobacterium sp. CY353]MCY0969434.1 hypothetical protein [Chryseobacterium sp. CY353]